MGVSGGGEQYGRSSLEAFRAIAENSPDLILRFDRQHRHVYVNPAVERRMRRPRHAIRGRTQRELGMPDGVAAQWHEELERVFRSGRERRFEFALGSTWVDAHEHFEALAVPERGDGGEIETVLVIVRDATERARAHAALTEREAALAEAQRIAGCGSFSWDPDGDVLRASAELARLVPLAAGEPCTLAELLAHVHADDRARVQRTLDDAARLARPWSMQLRLTDRDGAERVVHSRGEVATDGFSRRLHGTALDVTDQEDVQRTVRQLLRFAQFAVEHIEDAVVWLDAGGRLVSANHAARERFADGAEALLAAGWPDRWHQLVREGHLGWDAAAPGDAPVAVTAHHTAMFGHEYACLVIAPDRGEARFTDDDGELEIRSVGRLRALPAKG